MVVYEYNYKAKNGDMQMDKLLYGVAYYDEYMPYDRLEKDIEMMKAAGINTVRIAESTWSTLEPHNGVYNFYHIDRVLDAMHVAGIHVIIGTPTYAVPTWMVKEHPDVLATTAAGKNKYGPRQNMDITNPTFLFYAERIIRKLMEHVKDHPAIIGYQADNETKHYKTAGPNVHQQFVRYMQNKFPDIDQLNKEFGLDYWSNRINDWTDFPSVDATINASLACEFSKFQRLLVTKYLAWQVAIIKEYAKPDQFVTHNFDFAWRDSSYGIQTEVDHFAAAQAFDIAGVDIYHPSQDQLTGCEISFGGDITRSMKRNNYLVLETEAQAFLGWVPYPGQLRLQAFSHLASGADMVAYWHWHSLHNAIETYWKGLLSHDFEPNPAYLEAMTIGRDFHSIGDRLLHLKKENKVAILFSNEALSALNSFSWNLEGLEYNNVFRRMYDALYRMNVECDFLDPTSTEIDQYKLIVVPSLYAASDKLIDRLNRFVEKGGHVVYGVRSGFSNENVKVRHSKQPGGLDEVCGVYYSQFVSSKGVSLKGCGIEKTADIAGLENVMELLTPTTAQVLVQYEHPYWGEYAAVTQNAYGLGKATYMGCLPSEKAMDKILEQVVRSADLWKEEQEFQFPLIIKSGRNQFNKKIRYYMNYSMEEQKVSYLYCDAVELLSKEMVRHKGEVSIPAWGFKIFEEQ